MKYGNPKVEEIWFLSEPDKVEMRTEEEILITRAMLFEQIATEANFHNNAYNLFMTSCMGYLLVSATTDRDPDRAGGGYGGIRVWWYCLGCY